MSSTSSKPYYQRGGITLYHGDCLDVLPRLTALSVSAVVTSPPYAMQRATLYGGIPEGDYSAWTVEWIGAAGQALLEHGSVLINIREHVRRGEVSDYVHRTRLAVRAAGWIECDELIWIKTASPPIGHPGRPRRSWERILWFSPSRRAWCDPTANGRPSSRIGVDGTLRGNAAQWSPGLAIKKRYSGIARSPDYVTLPLKDNSKPYIPGHPAAYPVDLAAWMLRLVVPVGAILLDPFCGSGATLIAANEYGRRAIGVEIEERYCEIAARRLDALFASELRKAA